MRPQPVPGHGCIDVSCALVDPAGLWTTGYLHDSTPGIYRAQSEGERERERERELLLYIITVHMVGVKKKLPLFDPYNRRPFKKNGRRTGIERAMNGTARSVRIPVSF